MTHRVTFRASRHILLLAALLLLPMAAQAEFYYNGIYYEIGNDGSAYLLANPKGNKGNIAIPPVVVNSATGLIYIVTRIGDGAFKDNTEVTAIDMIAMNPAVSIGERTFKGCTGLKAAYLPINGLTTIGAEVFSGCSSLASITIPSNVTSISNTAFQGCTSLTQVTLSSNAIVSKDRNSGASMASIFGGQVQEYIIGGTGVTAIGNNAFNKCSSLTSVTILNSVTSIGQSAFENCYKLASITIPKSVTSIGEDAFANCIKLAGIRVEEGNPVYDSRDNSDAIIETSTNTLIAGCKNTVIPNSVTSIGEDAFFGCEGLTAISIPESVESIGGYAFSGCLHLAEVTIPNSVTSIYGHAFDNCESLTSVISKIEEPFELRSGVFPASYNCVLYVPKGTRDAYIAAGWERWFRGGIVEMDDGDDIREKMDVNGDDDVSTADVTAIYSYIINGESSGFTRDKANVNGDNDVNTADVTAIYNYIINGSK